MFEDQRDQAIEKLSQLKGRIQESTLYISVSERYENLSPNAQKGVWLVTILTCLFFIMSIPLGFVSSSNDAVADFNENRDLVANLIKVKSVSSSTPSVPTGLASGSLKADIERTLESEKILDEQIVSVTAKNEKPQFLPKDAKAAVVEAKLEKLNLRQIVGLGQLLGSTKPTTKLLDLSIVPNADNDHYFNVTYTIASFGPPDRPRPPPPKKKSKRNRNNKRKKRR